MARKKKSKLSKIDVILLIDLVLVLIFTGIMVYLYIKTFAIPDTLVSCFYGAFTGEAFFCCLIKIFNIKSNTKDNNPHTPAQ
jgi:Na+/H+ antiporter NhaC